MYKRLIFILILSLCFACDDDEPDSRIKIIQETRASSPLPTPSDKITLPTPTDLESLLDSNGSPIPTPSDRQTHSSDPELAPEQGAAIVTGILMMDNDNPAAAGSLMPVINAPIFLAPIQAEEGSKVAFAFLDHETDPGAATGQTGVFIFRNVPPGRYVLMIMHGVEIYMGKNEDDLNYVITVAADMVLDLGDIYVNLPPL